MKRSLHISALSILIATYAAFPVRAETTGDAYRLGPMDKIRITVSEWSPANGEFKSRLDGSFSIGASGSMSLPLIGEMPVAGISSGELEQRVSRQYQSRLGLVEAPSTSVEVLEYRPFFITGSVERPGNYPYRPAMTVLQALSMAGGIFRRTDISLLQVGRDLETTRGEFRILGALRDEIIVRHARLSSELAEQDTIDFPAGLVGRQGNGVVARLMSQESLLLKDRRASLEADLEAQRQLKQLLLSEIKALEALEAVQRSHQTVVEKELEEQRVLVAKGLSTAPRLFPLETRVAEVEAKRRQIDADRFRAHQDVIKADQASRVLRSQRRAEVLAGLKEAQLKLEEVDQRMRTAERVIRDAENAVVESLGEQETRYSIVRPDGERQVETPAAETDPVLPGDVVRVLVKVRPPVATTPDGAPAGPTGAITSRPSSRTELTLQGR